MNHEERSIKTHAKQIEELRSLSQHELIEETKRAVRTERTAMLCVLHRLHEINRRGLHLDLGFSSLHEFCVIELKYSDGAAYRRIHAMRLIEIIPEAKTALSNGNLSLSNAATLEQYFKKEEVKDTHTKTELLREACGKSKEALQKLLYPHSQAEGLTVKIDQETTEQLKRLSEFMGISKNDLAAVIKRITKIALTAADPTLKKVRPLRKQSLPENNHMGESQSQTQTKIDNQTQNLEQTRPATKHQSNEHAAAKTKTQTKHSRYIPQSTKQLIWKRDGSQCTFTDPITKRRCSSRFALQLDHIIPYSYGGPSAASNLRLLCPSHNQLMAKRVFGKSKIEAYSQHRNATQSQTS